MNYLKKTICTLLALWTPIVFAYTNLVNSNGEISVPATAILLDENGEPRCKITGGRDGLLLSERFNEFIERNSEAGKVLDETRYS